MAKVSKCPNCQFCLSGEEWLKEARIGDVSDFPEGTIVKNRYGHGEVWRMSWHAHRKSFDIISDSGETLAVGRGLDICLDDLAFKIMDGEPSTVP